jgi:hypothetical protein
MLNMGLPTIFGVVRLMIRIPVGLYELNIISFILTRRGGTDANTPERPRVAILRDWHVGILGPKDRVCVCVCVRRGARAPFTFVGA